jgi:ribosomal protein S18 acetylase RimI-like enzyme
MDALTIRPMQPADLDFAAQCTAREGWASETRAEFESFYAYDPAGCFLAEAEGQRIGICVATSYGVAGFVGELIVVPQRRGQGVGHRLLERAIAYLHSRGTQSIFLDGVTAAVPLYERLGFRKVCRSLRFAGAIAGRVPACVRAMRADDLATVGKIDRPAFGADRAFFLQRRLALYPELCKVLVCKGEISGYIVGRRGLNSISAGPWVVRPEASSAAALLESLAAEVQEIRISLGVLETNGQAVETIRALGLVERPDPPWRMVLGSGELGASPQLYAIGSAAKG